MIADEDIEVNDDVNTSLELLQRPTGSYKYMSRSDRDFIRDALVEQQREISRLRKTAQLLQGRTRQLTDLLGVYLAVIYMYSPLFAS